MGKKRIAEGGSEQKAAPASLAGKGAKRRVDSATLHVEATYNNTKVLLSDKKGNTLAWSTSGVLGFRGAKKGTPFAAAKAAETIAERAKGMGVREVDVVVRGVGSGREGAIRAFAGKGIGITAIRDMTPVPHNGVRQPRPRRV